MVKFKKGDSNMKKENNLLQLGFLLYSLAYMINRFLVKISAPIYMGILAVSLICMIAGMVKIRKNQK